MLLAKIQQIHNNSRKTYGSPRIYKVLKDEGIKVGKTRVEVTMRDNGIYAKMKKPYKRTTRANPDHQIFPNLLLQNFSTQSPNQIWLSDITHIPTLEGWLYLCAIMDLHTRKIVSWVISDRMTQALSIETLDIAHKRQNPGINVIFHSDQGSQYTAKGFRKRLKSYKMIGSMSRKGNCWDNAPQESFFHTLKSELIYPEKRFSSRAEARAKIFDYIEIFYNRTRIHSAIGYTTPIAFEEAAMLSAA